MQISEQENLKSNASRKKDKKKVESLNIVPSTTKNKKRNNLRTESATIDKISKSKKETERVKVCLCFCFIFIMKIDIYYFINFNLMTNNRNLCFTCFFSGFDRFQKPKINHPKNKMY
jgi:hypothetical protein